MTRLPSINVPDGVENETAYIKAAQSRIMANRKKGALKRWIAESGQETVDLCNDFLLETGTFAMIPRSSDENAHYDHHPVVKASFGDFYSKMRESLLEWGRLTPGQEKAVLTRINRAKDWIAERAAEKLERDLVKIETTGHVGTVGERRNFDLTVVLVASFDSMYGTTHIHVMEDAGGNTIIYKGSKLLAQKGDRVSFKATIKAHDYRNRVPQTIVARPA
jgi:hypothetical protein